MSENIRVYSIVGPFLEHARIFHFRAGAKTPEEGQFLIGSGDWMSRNLHRRVEVAVPVEDPNLCKRIWSILNVQMQDNRRSWEMQSDGSYVRCKTDVNNEVDSQKVLMETARQRTSLASVAGPSHTDEEKAKASSRESRRVH